MILVYPLALFLCSFQLWRARRARLTKGRGWRWFVAWACAGSALTFSFLTGLSIGLFLAPGALFLLLLVTRASPQWSESIGLLEGTGWILLLVAFLNRDYRPCPSGGLSLAPGQNSASCGGFDPVPWLSAGAAAALAALLTYALVARRRA